MSIGRFRYLMLEPVVCISTVTGDYCNQSCGASFTFLVRALEMEMVMVMVMVALHCHVDSLTAPNLHIGPSLLSPYRLNSF